MVEDDAPVRALVQSALEQLDYRVFVATDEFQALEQWEENQGEIQLLLTDVTMPKPKFAIVNPKPLISKLRSPKGTTKTSSFEKFPVYDFF
ncbi:MAG: response regulator, partial [Actinomycetota bacterium]